jgi:hypothetical protein
MRIRLLGDLDFKLDACDNACESDRQRMDRHGSQARRLGKRPSEEPHSMLGGNVLRRTGHVVGLRGRMKSKP